MRDSWGSHSRQPTLCLFCGVMVNTLDSKCNNPGSIPGPGGAAWIWVYSTTLVVVPCLPRGMLNRGAICVCMHLRSCMDVEEPG